MPKTIISKLQEDPLFLKNGASKTRKAKAKKPKFKKITFKITDSQKRALEYFCKKQQTTPVRFLKSVIRKQTARYKSGPLPVNYATPNQLLLFDMEPEVTTVTRKKQSTG
jgi:hypothetical protein